ncbi:MAG TPA: response regulator [Polyangia bacterium]|nr:response regulator [Polyangia bacterium]
MSGSGRRRILVVEDDPEILGALSGLLEEEGYDVQSVADARDALERLRHGPTPEVIILDLMMPGMDGWEFRTIQRADPELAAIPVVAISADTSSKAAAIDATSFLRKPFRFADLLSTVEKIIDERERRRIRARLAEAERLASLGTLAAGAAHEISNPLSFTVANLETMDEQLSRLRQMTAELSARQLPEAHLLEDMKATLDDMSDLLADGRVGAERVSRVVRNLQSIARRQEEQHRLVDIRRVIESSLNLTWNQIRHRARLVKSFPDELPLIQGSEFRLGQLMLNLLVNAAQAIQEGNAQANEIRVSVRREGGSVVVEVADTGEGIAPEARPRLFEPFFTTKPAGVGTGLGLSICQSVVLEHRGAIDVDSEPGKGSLFRVTLPLPAEQRPPAVEKPVAPEPAGRRGQVIIIDDEPQLAWAMKRLLDPEHDVVAVTHGREALDRMLAGERFDVIVCDLTMPYMTGEQLYREIESRFGADVASRILFVTGGALSEEGNAFLQAVRNPLLFKPFDPAELRGQVRRVMSTQAAPAEA